MNRIRTLAAAATALIALATAVPSLAKEPKTGQTAPPFALKDLDGQKRSLLDFKGKYVVLEWVNHGCPFVKKHYGSGNMQALQTEYTAKGVAWLSICSSAEGKQGHHSAADWKALNAEKKGAATAVLLDPDGTVGRLYGAKTTPHLFIVSPDGKLIYRGAIDDNPGVDPADIPTSKNYVRAALDEALAGKAVSVPATAPYGCSVKYE
jgi:peroxiredoxin